MRKIKFFTMLAAATALMAGVTGCNNDDDMSGGGQVDEGKATQMTLSISFPNNETRATGDTNATEAEAEVKTVDVFIYNGAGAFISHTPLTISDFTPNGASGTADEYTYSGAKIKTTTGTKNVYVGINLPTGFATTLKGKNMGELSTVASTLTRAQLTTIANGLPMFSSTPATSTFVETETDPANTVTVTVERLVAKVTVEAAADIDVAGVTGMGTLGELEFAINNFNERMYLVQGAAPNYKDPNWDSQTLTAGWLATDFSQATDADYVTVLDKKVITLPTVDDYNVRYASENTSREKLKGEITRATIRSTFIPTTITISDGSGGYTTTTGTKSSPATFWAVTPTGKATAFFETKSIADAYAADNGSVDVLEYEDGYCYWDMFLNKKTGTNKAAQWDVLRNEYFKCTITRIAALGRPDPGVVPPGVTPDEDTKISVNIDVLFWNTPVEADYELAP